MKDKWRKNHQTEIVRPFAILRDSSWEDKSLHVQGLCSSKLVAGHEVVTDTRRVTTCRCSFKAHLCRKNKKLKNLLLTWLSSKNHWKISGNEKYENFTIATLASENDPQEHKGPENNRYRKKLFPVFFERKLMKVVTDWISWVFRKTRTKSQP